MDNKELKKLAEQRRTALQLRMVAAGLYVDQVFGKRLLVHLVTPHTELDDYEKIGIVIPNKEDHTPMASTGIVVKLGTQLYDPQEADIHGLPPDTLVDVGDMIMFSRYAGTDFQIEQDSFRILDIHEVICRLKASEGAPVEVVGG